MYFSPKALGTLAIFSCVPQAIALVTLITGAELVGTGVTMLTVGAALVGTGNISAV